ncbi:MAG: hypothetical protein EBQ92_10230 [Proteobacteria bacterium]|nr:hypothetical protein [Pseudomonadota bacterium]
MKKLIILALGFTVLLGLNGCGKEELTSRSKTPLNTCPLYFASENLCGEISWVKGPSADVKSEFTVAFWKKAESSPSGQLTEPKGQVGAFLRMTCCGSVSFPQVKKLSEGKYAVTEASFTPGKWEVYVQLKQGDQVDKQLVKVQVDD